jgi:hypothetical protein
VPSRDGITWGPGTTPARDRAFLLLGREAAARQIRDSRRTAERLWTLDTQGEKRAARESNGAVTGGFLPRWHKLLDYESLRAGGE